MKTFSKSILATAILSLAACSGDDGQDGATGPQGEPGASGPVTLIASTVLSEGDSNCPAGGVQFDSGVDANSNDSLDAGEISDTQFACLPYTAPEAFDIVANTTGNSWYSAAAETVSSDASYTIDVGAAKNVIVFVGDGMGVSTVTAARILEGQLKGKLGEENVLSFGKFPFAGLAKTYNVDAQTPDSAGTMTAMMSGVKTDVGVLGVDADIVRGDCSTVAGNELVSIMELAEIAGMSTGIISTARITHATPAATYAKSPDRNFEDDDDIADAIAGGSANANCAGFEDIASQLVNFETNLEARYAGLDIDGWEVALGGGRRHFLPADAAANSPDARSTVEGDRADGRNLVTEWSAAYTDGSYVYDKAGFEAIDPETTPHLFGLFNESHMQYEADRHNDISGEPSLREMTEKAIQILDNNDDGYFLMVESGRIDHGHHAGSAYSALTDAIEFAEAVAKAVELSNAEDTLIIVTADHGHVFTIAGYPKRGNPILGKVVPVGSDSPSMAADGMPYTTVGYTNGRGFMNLGDETDADASYGMPIDAGREDLLLVDTETSGFHQEALVPLSSETHSGEDVGVYAWGAGAALLTGTYEQNEIFHAINVAAELVDKADAAVP